MQRLRQDVNDILCKIVKNQLDVGSYTVDGTPIQVKEDGTVIIPILTECVLQVRKGTQPWGAFKIGTPVITEAGQEVEVVGTVSESIDGFRARVRRGETENEHDFVEEFAEVDFL